MSGTGKRRRYYQFDHSHKEIEVYDRNGKHIGVLDQKGNEIKSPVPGRRIEL